MSKQPHDVRRRLALSRPDLVLPNTRDPRQLWLLVRRDPSDGAPGCFFVTHGRNFTKFESRPHHTVLAHGYDRNALTAAARRATLAAGPAYQPKFSAHATGAAPEQEADVPDIASEPRVDKPDPDML